MEKIWNMALQYELRSIYEDPQRVPKSFRRKQHAFETLYRSFSCMLKTKITYKEEIYKAILDVLEEVSRRNPHLKVRVETLKAIVENAKNLKSNITCQG